MDGTRNEDFITSQTDPTGRWIFGLKSESKTVSDACVEQQQMIRLIDRAFASFILPKKCHLLHSYYSSDIDVIDVFPGEKTDPERMCERDYSESPALSLAEVHDDVSEICASEEEFAYINQTLIQDAAVNLRIRGYDNHISTDSSEYYKREVSGEPLDESAHYSPLDFDIKHRPGYGEDQTPMLAFIVRTHTDIWYADNEYGTVNRERLVAFFDRFLSKVDPFYVEFHSETTSQRTLEERGMGELIPNISAYQ